MTVLKADPLLADIPVIMLTIVDDKNLGYALGAADYLTKPVDRDRLAAILQKYRCAHPPCTVLVVEDDADTRDMLQRLLTRETWAVTEATNGRVALERMAESQPELILLDLMMPAGEGAVLVVRLGEERLPLGREVGLLAERGDDRVGHRHGAHDATVDLAEDVHERAADDVCTGLRVAPGK